MKKFLNNKRLVPSAVALLVILGFVNSIGAISMSGGLAQVFTFSARQETHTYYVRDNSFGATEGLTFKQNKIVTVTACAAGGGGGAGDRGVEDGLDDGVGGGGGGGGGKGECETVRRKVRAGDVIHWNVGAGGDGGIAGELRVVVESQDIDYYPTPYTLEDYLSTSGSSGGNTYVSVNDSEILQVDGGAGGHQGLIAYMIGETPYTGDGGDGGSANTNLAQTTYRGENGNWWSEENGWMGNGGNGGYGEGQGGPLLNRGYGGDSTPGDPYGPYGGDAGNGSIASGGGGGGGGAGRWYDFEFGTENSNTPNYAINQRGGNGGDGGDGYVEFSW